MTEDRFQDLLSRLLDDELTETELDELARLAAERPERVGELRGQLQMADRLSQYEDELRSEARFLDALDARLAAESPQDDFVDRAVRTVQQGDASFPSVQVTGERRRRLANYPLAAGLVVAVAAFLVALVWNPEADHLPPSAEPGVAVLTRAVDVTWRDGQTHQPGTIICPGSLQLESGLIELSFGTGATVVIEGRAEVNIFSAEKLSLKQGRLWARVPDEARGFTVRTPEAEVVDLGTEFGVLVEPAGAAEVYVFDGFVEVAPGKGGTQRFAADEAVRVEAGQLRAIESDATKFARGAVASRRVELVEDFRQESLDPKKWRTILSRPQSRVEPADGAVHLINRSHLVTAAQFDPVTAGRLRVTGTFRFPTFGPHATFHTLEVVTRADGRTAGEYFKAASGIVFQFSTRVPIQGSMEGAHAQILTAGADFRITSPTVVGRLAFKHDASYRFEIVDDGLHLSATMTEVGNPANRVTVTATIVKDESDTNHVAFYGREQREEGKDLVVQLADLRITLGNP